MKNDGTRHWKGCAVDVAAASVSRGDSRHRCYLLCSASWRKKHYIDLLVSSLEYQSHDCKRSSDHQEALFVAATFGVKEKPIS